MGRRRPDAATVLMAGAFAAVAAAAFCLRLGPLLGGQLDYDEGVYWQSLRSLDAGHALYSSTYSSQPPAFLTMVHPWYAVFGHSLTGARIGILAISALGYAALVRTVHVAGGVWAALVAAVLVGLDPLAIHESVALQADGPSVWLGVIALALMVESRVTGSKGARVCYVAAGAFLTCAVLTKLFAVVFAVPIGVAVATVVFAENGSPLRWRSALIAAAAVAAGGVVAAVVVLVPYVGAWDALWSQVVAGHVTARSLTMGGFTADVTRVLWRQAPELVAAVAGIALWLYRDTRQGAVLVAWLIPTAALILWQRPLWMHHLILGVPVVVAGAALLIGCLLTSLPGVARALVGTGLVVASTVVVVVSTTGPAASARAATPLMEYVAARNAIVTDDQFGAAQAGIGTPPELVDTSFVRVASGGLTAADLERVIARDDVRAVTFVTGRLASVPGFRAWVEANFPQHHSVPGVALYIR